MEYGILSNVAIDPIETFNYNTRFSVPLPDVTSAEADDTCGGVGCRDLKKRNVRLMEVKYDVKREYRFMFSHIVFPKIGQYVDPIPYVGIMGASKRSMSENYQTRIMVNHVVDMKTDAHHPC